MKKKVVIVGGGFGGLAAAKALAHTDVGVVVIDRQNHHLFQPLLYQVATAALSPADIAWPIRRILRYQKNARVIMATVTGIDAANKRVLMGDEVESYDFLIVASGATHSYFGHAEWAPYAPGLKDIVDATHIRRRMLTAFEQAEIEDDSVARERLLTFVIVGGGPTGVEMAGAIVEVARKALAADFRRIDPRTARVVLVEAGPKLLSAFTPGMTEYARRALGKLGVEVRLGAAVTGCDAEGVRLGDEAIPSATIIWAAGVAASPAADWLAAKTDRNHRVVVNGKLEVEGLDQVFVVGDTAKCVDDAGQPLPGVATVAKQQGRFVGRLIAARLRGKQEPERFRYRNVGQLATIGRRAALVDLGWIRFKGRLAWWFWGIVHIYFLIGNRSRLTIAIQWLWSFITFDRGARLIVRDD
jgi:NADH:quinone reductase (non-electrogenic)